MFVSEIGKQVVKLHQQGVPSLHIAHRLNVAQSTVHYHLRRLREPGAAKQAKQPVRTRKARSTIRTQERVAQLLSKGVRRIEIARILGISKSTVSYHARRLGQPIDERCRRRYDWAIVQEFYDEGHSVRDCIREFGFSSQTWHQAMMRGLVTARPAFKPDEEVFARNTHRNRGHLKERLLQAGLKDGTCERCGIAEWRDQAISLALHHINGDRLDNRIENLELLCPNCHSQTDTFSGRNGHGKSGRAAA
jgi:DNA-binding CsgD family transcriptional regulator/5-methylcytosine-specific restriction endonuclease McrA